MYCTYCGRAVSNDASFCQFCGNKLIYGFDGLRNEDQEIELNSEDASEFLEDSYEDKIEENINVGYENEAENLKKIYMDRIHLNKKRSIAKKRRINLWSFSQIFMLAVIIGIGLIIFVNILFGKSDDSIKSTESNSILDDYNITEDTEFSYRQEYDYLSEFNQNGVAVAGRDGYYGFIDNMGHELIEFIYEEAENFVDGLALVKKDGYYGYIDERGNAVIGFYYDMATSFDPEYQLAIVGTGGGKGVIDYNGELVVDTQYIDVYFDSGFIVVSEDKNMMGDLLNCGIYTTTGNHIIEDRYREFYFSDNKIYANDDYESFGHSKSSLGDVYDFNGTNLLNEEPLLGATAITPPYNGICIVQYDDVFYYSLNGSHEYSYYLYCDENLNLVYNAKLSSATAFNKLGYAIVCHSLCNNLDNISEDTVRYFGMRGNQYFILQNNEMGIQEVQRLPEPDYLESYKTINDYYIVLHDGHGNGSDMLLDRGSLNKISCYNPSMVDGTNCIIVQNENSELYGLYDGRELVKDYLFNNIVYDSYTNTFLLTRGAEIEEYVPINSSSNMLSLNESGEADSITDVEMGNHYYGYLKSVDDRDCYCIKLQEDATVTMTFNHKIETNVEGIGWCITHEDDDEPFQSYMAWINLDAVSEEYTLGKGTHYFYVENNRPVDEVNQIIDVVSKIEYEIIFDYAE